MALEQFFDIAINADDIEASTAFYRDVLGGDVLGSGDAGDGSEYVVLSVADKRIYCFERPPYEINGLVEDSPTGVLHFGFVVPDAESAVADLESTGAVAGSPPPGPTRNRGRPVTL
jgi:catechol 2,3-dioxygenase-like lactoylglutathione lyase family enzyme